MKNREQQECNVIKRFDTPEGDAFDGSINLLFDQSGLNEEFRTKVIDQAWKKVDAIIKFTENQHMPYSIQYYERQAVINNHAVKEGTDSAKIAINELKSQNGIVDDSTNKPDKANKPVNQEGSWMFAILLSLLFGMSAGLLGIHLYGPANLIGIVPFTITASISIASGAFIYFKRMISRKMLFMACVPILFIVLLAYFISK